MLYGVATASSQIEGCDISTNWSRWEKLGKIKDKSSVSNANQHYKLYAEDTKLMAEMGIKEYRMSIEWALIEPSKDKFDESAINHYIDEIKLLKKEGINVILTLHHFSNPQWFDDLGGFVVKANNIYFINYVFYLLGYLKGLVNEFITINEPNVFACFGYFYGEFPPGGHSFKDTMKVYKNFGYIHKKCYELIHQVISDAKVSYALHMVKFVPYKRNSLINKFFAMIADQLFQTQCLKNYTLNKKTFLFPKHKEFKLKCYVDFHAINYYRLLPIKTLKFTTYANHHKNDLEWEIYPQGIVDCIEKANNIISLPVYITENGTCDTNDKFRCRYIYDHVKVLLSCKYDVKKYYHWCFIDNFEWCEGESARFGLVHNDFKTQERTIKKSGRFYSDLIKFGLNKNLYDKYVSSETYHN